MNKRPFSDDPDAGQWRIDPDGGIDGVVDGVEVSPLEDSGVNMIAADLAGYVWAIGGVGDENGGVYRVDAVAAAEAAAAEFEASIV